jgi:hypothetical protein
MVLGSKLVSGKYIEVDPPYAPIHKFLAHYVERLLWK